MKNLYAWQLAIATALGAYGGFPTAPKWWIKLSESRIFQFFTLWLLIYSRNKSGHEYAWTTLIAVIIYFTMYLTNLIFCKEIKVNKNKEEVKKE